jgi:predicted DNA-binding transcriptional regulator YafY
LAHREGLGSRELAKRLGVTQRQANRDIDVLINAGFEVLTDGERYSLRKTQALRSLVGA